MVYFPGCVNVIVHSVGFAGDWNVVMPVVGSVTLPSNSRSNLKVCTSRSSPVIERAYAAVPVTGGLAGGMTVKHISFAPISAGESRSEDLGISTLYLGRPFKTVPERDMGRNGDLTTLLFLNPTRSSISPTEFWFSTATNMRLAEAGPRCKDLKLPEPMLELEFLIHNDLPNTDEVEAAKQPLNGFGFGEITVGTA